MDLSSSRSLRRQQFKEGLACPPEPLNASPDVTTSNEMRQGSSYDGRSAAIEAVEDIAFGSCAGIVGKYVEYPFDTVKVRLQSQREGQPLPYNGPLDCFRKSIRADGFLGLYRGISAPLVGAALEASSIFFFERMGREVLYLSGVRRDLPLPLSSLWLTGAFSGVFTSFVLTPIELVKCKIQVPAEVWQRPAALAMSSSHSATPRPLAVVRDVYLQHGLLGFWHGQLGTLIREAGGCAAWFGAKETVSKMFRVWNARRATPAERNAVSDSPLPLWQQALAGASAGVAYNFLFFPADTIKSRMQTTPIGHDSTGQTFRSEGAAIWREHGARGFYRGCGVTCLRSAPSSAFIFIIYDALKRCLLFDARKWHQGRRRGPAMYDACRRIHHTFLIVMHYDARYHTSGHRDYYRAWLGEMVDAGTPSREEAENFVRRYLAISPRYG